jgi:hypothetical protein
MRRRIALPERAGLLRLVASIIVHPQSGGTTEAASRIVRMDLPSTWLREV